MQPRVEVDKREILALSAAFRLPTTKRRLVREEPRPGAERKLSDKEEALLVATACSSPPAGRAHWTLKLLADALVRLTAHESVSRETVRRRLAENDLKPWRKDMWCIPQVDADYVARMEDVLDLYAEAPDPKRPVVCFDESWLLVIFSSVLFGAYHWWTGVGNIAEAVLIGLLLMLFYLRSVALWPVVLAHYLTDVIDFV